MSQVTYEIIRKLFEIYPIILQIVLFLVLWNVFFRWEKGIWIVAGILAVMNICMGLWLEKPGVIRYTMSAVIVLGYCFCKYQKHLENAVFILLLFYNFHALSYLIADSIYQCTVESIFRGLDVLSEEYIFRVYLGMAIGMGILLLSYTLVLLIMTGVVIKIVKKPFMLRWQETIFLSVLNIVGSMIVGISLDLSVVQIEGGVFLLYDDKQEMLWKLPIIAVLIYVGEISAIYIYQNYRKLQKERQKHFVEEQQVKAMKQRLEEAENFYGSIRRVRHEMKNHMTNIKGLVASEKYDEVENYIEKLDETIQTMDYKFNTGNAVTDVIINNKYQKAENAGISFQVKFNLGETDTISAFDIGIILNNLLDNAIEACEKLEQEQRYINLTLKKKNHFLLIEVENSFDGKVIWEDGGIV
ncbi:MAG: GHKL domain-containing protein, partial [Lachnospira sp.]|nr:GHKL domain-containing protein [Lachnospira sp.]